MWLINVSYILPVGQPHPLRLRVHKRHAVKAIIHWWIKYALPGLVSYRYAMMPI